jgi:hypothetical protein
MRNHNEKSLYIVASTLLFGCASTPEDFEAMTLSERQSAVCFRADAYKSRKERISTYESVIGEKQAVLSRGYRVHWQCQKIKVTAPPKDCSAATKLDKTVCERDTFKTECTETPVSIDPRYETEVLEKNQKALENFKRLHSEKTNACLDRVSSMPAQAAYIYYSEKLEPQ